MNVFAIADLHLAFGVPEKKMGNKWQVWLNHEDKLHNNFHRLVQPEDIVLIAGDISWAINLEEARPDFNWIESLPGRKILLKGNHDYWWPSDAKLHAFLPPSIQFIHKNALLIDGVSVGGTRLWENDEIDTDEIIDFIPSATPHSKVPLSEQDQKIFLTEVDRLEKSLSLMQEAPLRIAMTHYPPIDPKMHSSRFTNLFEQHHINHVLFGHIHNAKKFPHYGEKNGVVYHLVAADYLDFCPKLIATL